MYFCHQCSQHHTHLGRRGRIWFLKHGPDAGFDLLPPGEGVVFEGIFQLELAHHLLGSGLVGVEVQAVQDLQRLLRVSMRRVSHPTTRLYLVVVCVWSGVVW